MQHQVRRVVCCSYGKLVEETRMLCEEHARHFLSDSEREAFERDGFIVLGGVLEPHEVAEYTQLVDTIYEEQMTAEVDPYTTGLFGSDQPFFYPNILCRDQRFVDLLDHPRVFPKVLGILGWNIYAYHSHLIVTPPGFMAPYGFHEDSGRTSFDMGVRPAPRLTVKAAYWLAIFRNRTEAICTWSPAVIYVIRPTYPSRVCGQPMP